MVTFVSTGGVFFFVCLFLCLFFVLTTTFPFPTVFPHNYFILEVLSVLHGQVRTIICTAITNLPRF